MARKFDLISELYERTCFAVTDNPVNWQSFLKTAGRNFRLRFDEQLLIYAQRPDATAVLEIERWNSTFGRWVNRGAKGIAVFEDADRSRQRLIHYFDISDTHESRHSRPVPIWEMRPEYEAEVIETLENTFGAVNDTTSIENVVKESIFNAVEDNIADYISDFMSLGAGSDIEYLSADEANALYLELVRNSVSYMVINLCFAVIGVLDNGDIAFHNLFGYIICGLIVFHSIELRFSTDLMDCTVEQITLGRRDFTDCRLPWQNRLTLCRSLELSYGSERLLPYCCSTTRFCCGEGVLSLHIQARHCTLR